MIDLMEERFDVTVWGSLPAALLMGTNWGQTLLSPPIIDSEIQRIISGKPFVNKVFTDMLTSEIAKKCVLKSCGG